MQNKPFLCAVCTAVISASVAAADVIVFPNADSSGDLASLAAWNRDSLPTESNVHISASGTYTASKDVSFNGIRPNSANLKILLDMTPSASGAADDEPRKISVGSDGVFMNSQNNSEFTFTGGVWDFQNIGSISLYGTTYGVNNQKLFFTDVTVTNLVNLKGGYGGSGQGITIGSGANIYTSQCEFDGYQSNTSLFEIKDGGYLYAYITNNTGFVLARAGSNSGGKNTLRVTGENSRLTVEGSGQVFLPSGDVNTGHLFHVTSGGHVKLAKRHYKFVGGQSRAQYGVSQRWLIDNGGLLETYNSVVLLGHNGDFARIDVFDGGTWTNASLLSMGSDYLCSGNNTLMVSNGLYYGTFPIIGRTENIQTNNLVHLVGPRTCFFPTNTKDILLFPLSHGNKFMITDGAVWTNNVSEVDLKFSGQSESCSNLFAVLRGATYYSTNNLYISDSNYDVCSNVILVADGALVHASALKSSAAENGIVVSNAVLETENEISFSLTSYSTMMRAFSNCWMRVEGSSPRVKAGTSFSVLNRSSLRFVLPESGYDAGVTPVTCGTKFSVAAGSRIYVDGVEALACAKKHPFDVVLLEAEDGVSLGSGVLEEANAYIASSADKSAKSSLKISKDGTQLILHVSYPDHTVILIR